MKKSQVILGILIPLCAVGDGADTVKKGPNGDTNAASAEIDITKAKWSSLVTDITLGEQFKLHFKERIEAQSERKLHRFNSMTSLLSARNQNELDERTADIGKGLVQKSLEQSIREIVNDIPFVYRAANQDSFLARLFINSVGNTDEEDFSALKTTYTTNEIAQWESVLGVGDASQTNSVSGWVASWRRLRESIHPRYGLRWNYAYAAFTIGRNKDKPLMFAHVRYHYDDMVSDGIMATDLETLISVPIGDKTFFTAGMVQNIDLPDGDRRSSFRISQKLDGGKLFVGITIRQTSTSDRVRYVFGWERYW